MKLKKLLSVLLLLAMTSTLFCSCSKGSSKKSEYSDDPNEAVKLVIAWPFAETKDAPKVQEAVNKKLETLLPNTELEFLLESKMGEKWTLWMAAQKPIDIAHSGFDTVLETEVVQGDYLELDDLVEEYGPNIQKMAKKYWNNYNNAKIGGKLYAIPNVQTYINNSCDLRIDEKYAKEISDITWKSDKTTKELYQKLTEIYDAKVAAGEDIFDSYGVAFNTLQLYNLAKRGYTFIAGMDNICFENSSDSGKILDFYQTQEFKDYMEYTQIWAKKGWVSKDILANNTTTAGLIASRGTYFKMDEETHYSNAYNGKSVVLDNPEHSVLTTKIGDESTYYSIPFTSQHPERAMRFLDLINSEEGKDILNLMAYGIEGEHYEFIDKEKGQIKAFDYEGQGTISSKYSIPAWMVGPMTNMYEISPFVGGYRDYAEEYYTNLKNTKKHVLYGIEFDLSEVSAKISNVNKNNSEFAPIVYCGVSDNPQGTLDELIKKNKAAGLDDIIKCFQKQADEYMK